MVAKFIFVDDAIVPPGDAERYRALLSMDDLSVTALAPVREELLIPEAEIEPNTIDGFILDINLRDHVQPGKSRFVGTGAGLAQDLRLLQATNGADGQRPRPIVRLCAAQVFQQYLAGDNSTAEVFDLGFDKETIADVAVQARRQIAALPDVYEGIISAGQSADAAASLLGLPDEEYGSLHSAFRNAFEIELGKKVHEAAGFLMNSLILRPGLLISEALLAVRLGIDADPIRSPGWTAVLERFGSAKYAGRGAKGFPLWWMHKVLAIWQEISSERLYSISSARRTDLLTAAGLEKLSPIAPLAISPGDRPWAIAQSDMPELRLPVDPAYAYPLTTPSKAWLDEPVWCLEQAKQQRRSLLMSEATRARLAKDIRAKAAD